LYAFVLAQALFSFRFMIAVNLLELQFPFSYLTS
jgi:hypothetical protein